MRSGRRGSEKGQTLAEYAIIVAAIALVCAVAALLVSGWIGGQFDPSTKPNTPAATFFPPKTTVLKPQTEEDCTTDPGWHTYGYDSLEDCLADVP